MTNRPKAYSYIRMSTETQLRGDSKRRQEEASRRYAAQHDLDLVEGSELHDIGISAFKGRNVSGGALGRFLEAVKMGRVEAGSYLLMESLDRLSRQEIMRSLTVFTDIMTSGIKLVTLTDGAVYERDRTDFAQLIYSLVIMSRAHEESQMKSERVSAAWAQLRDKAHTQKMTAQGPAWLKLRADRSAFDVVPERAQIVNQIFVMCDQGMGAFSIAKTLTSDAVPTFGRSAHWSSASVNKILGNRAVLGEFQPKSHGQEVGDAIKDYFPAIVDRDLFNRCQASRSTRQVTGAGRKGERVANLFSGLATCGECGSKMRYFNKGSYAYLMCAASREGNCPTSGWPYEAFEKSFLSFVAEVDFTSLSSGEVGLSYENQMRHKEKSLDAELRDLSQKRDQTADLIGDVGASKEYVTSKLDALTEQIQRLEEERTHCRNQIDALSNGPTIDSFETLRDLSIRQDLPKAGYTERAHAMALIKDQVDLLVLHTDGDVHTNASVIAMLENETPDVQAGAELEKMRALFSEPLHSARWFGVAFKSGPQLLRCVTPEKDNPAKLKSTVTRRRDGLPDWLARHSEILGETGSAG